MMQRIYLVLRSRVNEHVFDEIYTNSPLDSDLVLMKFDLKSFKKD